MDVTFTNVLEGARQYFQGLPTGSSSTVGPTFATSHIRNDAEQNSEMPPSSQPYWPAQHEMARPPAREHTPIQRPPSQHSDTSRPPSHTQYMHNMSTEQNRSQGYQNSYQESPTSQSHQQQQQTFQFSRPQSREAPSNHLPQQQHQQQQYQQHIPTSSPYHHQPASPQQPRVPSRPQEQLVIHPPSSQQSYHQLQTSTHSSQPYQNYQSKRSYFNPPHSQAKPTLPPSNNTYKASSMSPYSSNSQQNTYYKQVYSSQPQTSNQMSYVSAKTSVLPQEVKRGLHPTSLPSSEQDNSYRAMHNLPPIAALSSVNYHSNRNSREPIRQSSSSRPRTLSSGFLPPSTMPQSSLPVNNNPSIIQPNPYSAESHRTDLQRSSSYVTRTTNQSYSYTTAQSYNHVVMTTSSTSNAYTTPLQSQSSASPHFYQQNKSNTTQQISGRNQPVSVLQNQNMHHLPVQNVVDRNGRLAPVIKQKRESPLDLSVKTVRTPADSTLDDAENDNRKYYATNRTTAHSSISSHNYPTYDVPSFQRNLTQRSSQLQSATAPKVEFHPNFNAPALNQPQSRNLQIETQRHSVQTVPEKIHNNNRISHEKNNPYPPSSHSIPTSRYPVVSVPSAAHVNNYIQPHPKKSTERVAVRNDVPMSGQKMSSIYTQSYNDIHKKRPSDVPLSAGPNKIPKSDLMKQIDMQIEQRFSNYKEQQQQKQIPTKSPIVNGNYPITNQDKMNEIHHGGYQKHLPQPFGGTSGSNNNHYHSQSMPTQTYVPSPGSHPYPYSAYPSSQQHQQMYMQQVPRSNASIPSLPSSKANLGGVDKRVLSLLRTSLESKGAKKLDQLSKSHESVLQHARPDVQHPSTDVTAPLQPKQGMIGRNNVSPFTPTSFPESHTNMTSMYKFHVPKAIDSVNYDHDTKHLMQITDKQVEESQTIIPNVGNTSDYDGLAAFLAARIRTKGELKQGGPSQNASNNNTTSNIHLNSMIENHLKSPPKQESSQSCSTSSGSPPKLMKERNNAFAPRRRLFSRNEDEMGNNVNVPLRDKSGLRSSSETSVFDFPDSDSETDMPVLERQSLEAMRRDRKSSLKPTSFENTDTIKVESPRPVSPGDDEFAQACDSFVEQLKTGSGKKRGRRKKGVEPEVLAKLEDVAKENPLEDIKIKVELTECQPVQDEVVKDKIDEVVKTEDKIPKQEEEQIPDTKTIDDSSDNESEPEIIEEPKVSVKIELEDEEKEKVIEETPKETKDEEESPQKNATVLPVARPAKKPSFGDGSDFYPGWEEGVYKFKKSCRMPPSLIQVTRPPQFHRLSTSLPDLDPYPNSPTPSLVTTDNTESSNKKKNQKLKSDPIDSDNESNCSINLFNKQNNYDSESGSSIKSLPNMPRGGQSILDKILEKCAPKKKRKYKKREEESPKIIPKSENSVELLATPSLEISTKEDDKELKKLASPVIKTESAILGFRKKTVENFKDAFMKTNSISTVKEQFATVILKSRTRKETRVLKQRATIKEVFGEDRPASAPPVTCVNDIKIKEEMQDIDTSSCLNITIKKEFDDSVKSEDNQIPLSNQSLESVDTKQVLKNKLLNRGKKRNNVIRVGAEKKIKIEFVKEENETSQDAVSIKDEPDLKPETPPVDGVKSETPSIDGDEGSISGRKKNKLRNMRRKFSSGFDYIRKKKKQVKKDSTESENTFKQKKRGALPKANPESVQDIQKEIKTWVLNKGIGETHLHRAARLGYTDITAYCLEKMECHPSPKDNAGYTPLHEACSRGHLDIAKLLLLFGANVSESAQGGVRPLHEAVENGFVEIVRLLLSYGADPMLATYSGLTPMALASDEMTSQLLINHINDVRGLPGPTWTFKGPATFFDSHETGYNILTETPEPDPLPEEEDIEFEMSEVLLPNLYTLREESPNDRWILLQDLSNILKIKSRDALLKQICPTAASTSSSASVNYKAVIRELKMSDFLEQSHCCQFLNAGEKINTRASKIALVKYTDKVRELLNVEKVLITIR